MQSYLSGQKSFIGLMRRCAKPETDLEHNLAIEQQSNYIAMAGTMGAVNALNSAAVTVAFYLLTQSIQIIFWFILVNLFTVSAWRLRQRNDPSDRPARTRARILFQSETSLSVLAAVWSLPALIFASSGFETLIFVSLVVTGMSAGFASIMSTVPRIVVRFIAFSCLPVMLTLFLFGGATGQALCILGLAFVAITAKGCLMSFDQLRRVVQATRDANTARHQLLVAIEAIHDAFAIYDRDGELEMSNSRFREWFPKGAPLDERPDGSLCQVGKGRWVMRSVVPVSDGRTVSIHTDITALKTRERELIAARREAEDANAAKGRFLSTMSHELRTPLNIINGFSRLMKADSKLELNHREVADYAGSIHMAGEHLLTVINDIIEFSKIGADRYLHDPEEVDLRELLARAVSLSASFQQIKSLDGVDVSVSPNLGGLVVDEMAFRRIIINLVTNALKFGGDPVKISVRAFVRSDGSPVITIRDYGHGLTPDELDKVFEPFFQCERDRAGEFSGTGLGLPLSRELARLHGGDVYLTSRVGAGTTASIVLPPNAHIPPEVARVPGELAALTGGQAA